MNDFDDLGFFDEEGDGQDGNRSGGIRRVRIQITKTSAISSTIRNRLKSI